MGDGFGDVDEFSAVALGVIAEELEGLLFVDAVSCHEDALRPFDGGPSTEGAFEVVELGEAAQGDVDR